MLECLKPLFFEALLMLHGLSYLRELESSWLQIVTESSIVLFYYSISLLLIYFFSQRPDLPQTRILMIFGAFTIASGTTHLIDIVSLWQPNSWLAEGLEANTTAISLCAALLSVPLFPKNMARLHPVRLEKSDRALTPKSSASEMPPSAGGILHLDESPQPKANLEQHDNERLTSELALQRQHWEEELRKSEERYRAVVEDRATLICRFLSDGTLTFVNNAFCGYVGKTREELVGRNFFQMIPDEYREKTQKQIAALSRKNPVATRESRIVKSNGDILWQQWTDRLIAVEDGEFPHAPQCSSLSLQGGTTGEERFSAVEYQSVGRDITERVLAEQQSARLASFPLLSPNPIVETDLGGRVSYLNPEAMQALPDLQETGIGHPFLAELLAIAPVLQREGAFRREVKIGEAYYEQFLHHIPEIQCLRIYAFDVTDRKRAEEQLIHNAFYDRLTGLANRALFMDRLKQAVRRATQGNKSNSSSQPELLAVLFLNLNRFKLVNGSLGNQIGDELLRSFAQRLQTCLRPTDTVARLGGDEFAILLEGIQDASDATNVADAIHQTLASPFHFDTCEVFMTLSIGIALSTSSDEQAEDLLRDAGIAMYRAKAQGRCRYEVFDKAMHDFAVDRLQLETDLRRAIERQEFQVYYQPIVSLSTNQIIGFEALLRWRHPKRGLVSPLEFIPVAEETGLIAAIGWWVLREACRQIKVWQEQFQTLEPLTMSVNLSCKQLLQPNLLAQIDKILQETQLAPGSLKLEITESVVVENPDLVKDLLLKLKQRNIHLSIDDFGTGYSSLSRLHHFPISTLKIDRSFISRMGTFGENTAIVQAIVRLAQSLNMDVVAEGIEMPEQISPLLALQCEYGQGNFFSKAVDSESAQALLVAQLPQGEKEKGKR